MSGVEPIRVVAEPVQPDALRRYLDRPFTELVKFVVDVDQGIIAIGGEMHVDAEAELIDRGSEQDSLWGGNYLPGKGEEGCIEYNSVINIRPSAGNRSMNVMDPAIRERMRAIVHRLLGKGEALA